MRIVAPLIALLLAGCATNPPVDQPYFAGKYRNACLPEAIAMTQALRQSGIQARVLTIYTPKFGHALCVYMYPTGQNKLWVWDSHWKSVNLRAWYDDPDSIAKAWLNWAHPTIKEYRALFRD